MADGGGLGNGFNWKGGNYPGTGGTCQDMLAAGAHCTVVVRFTPSGSGQRTSTLLIFYYDGANTQYAKRALSATATDKALAADHRLGASRSPPNGPGPPPYDYGTAGPRAQHTFTVTNWGAVPATLIADGGTLGGGFGWTGTPRSAAAPAARC